MERNKLLMVVAGLAAVVVVVVGFLLGVEPQLRSASQAQASQASVSTQNASLAAELTTLKAKYATIDTMKSALAQLQGSVPATQASSAFITEINAIAGSTGASVTAITSGDPVAYLAPVVAVTPDTSTATASASASPSASASATPAPVATATTPTAPTLATDPSITAANFSDIPITISITATNSQALSFLQELRTGQRLFMVDAINSTAATASTSSTSSSASSSSSNSPTWTISGLIYALTPSSAVSTVTK